MNTHQHSSSCHPKKKRFDWILWGSLISVTIFYIIGWQFHHDIENITWLKTMAHTVHSMMNTIWWGVLIGFAMVGVLSKVPREFVMSILGSGGKVSGVFRATFAGVLLDLCSHGILMVGTKLYERGASAGQVIAFLLASPWNSFSLTLILIALIGLPWTLAFIILSMVIAILTGIIFDLLVARGTLPANLNNVEMPDGFRFWADAKKGLKNNSYDWNFFKEMLLAGVSESRMVLRWLLFGVILAAVLRAVLDVESFEQYFGPTMLGLSLTILFATILEVCSEGSTPIAADIMNRAGAPGNGFAFLMAGVSTDYTEVMVMKDTTKSWKIALFIPLISLPQVILVAWLINMVAT
jgi:uncharacterized membrane protein YraQ (UPF0718 family)